MRPSQYLVRVVVFCCIIFDPSDGGIGILMGVILGSIIGFLAAGIRMLLRPKPDEEID